ncbi:MAG: FHA domain-containing protein [Bacteroidota bacterium]
MARYLIIRQNGNIRQRIELRKGENTAITLGANPTAVDVHLAHDLISRTHAQVLVDADGMVYVIDQKSTNGTFLNGKRLSPHSPYLIDTADKVTLAGKQVASLSIETGDATPPPPSPPPPNGRPSLLQLLQEKKKVVVGRGKDCDLVIDMPTISRKHAAFRLGSGGAIALTDLNSTNGTYVNGRRISGTVTVAASDVIVVGRSILKLGEKPRELSTEVAILARGIMKQFSNGKIGLRETDLNVPAGAMVAIMGPSGCGKSTLLKCLTGEAPPTKGTIRLAGLELIQNYDLLKSFIGYVPQDDIVHRQLTVYQSLFFAAKLRLDDTRRSQIDQKIDQVLQQLHIVEIKHSPIAKISGGQRKRVSIAVELLTDPLILFLDEPTSPLDPQTIAEFMKILQDLARSGTTVVMVTHKPEDLTFMDSVIFMAEGGYLCYNGPADAYKAHFGVETAVEVYANISGPKAKSWVARFQGAADRSAGTGSRPAPLQKRSNKSYASQLFWLSARNLRIKTNDLLNVGILIGQAPIIALLVCLIFEYFTAAVPFLVVLSAIWFGTSNAAREIVSEASVYRRERMFNLRIGPYILSKLVVLSLFALIQAVLFSTIIYLRFHEDAVPWTNLPGTILWVWYLTVSATVLGLMLSALVNTAEKVMTLVPLVLIPQVMLAGVVAPIRNGVVEILSYFAMTRWGYEGLVLIQGEVGVNGGVEETLVATDAKTVLEGNYPSEYEDTFGDLAYQLELDVVAVGVLTLIVLVVLVAAMRRKDAIS